MACITQILRAIIRYWDEADGCWRGGTLFEGVPLVSTFGPNRSFDSTIDAAHSVTKAATHRGRSIFQRLNVTSADKAPFRFQKAAVGAGSI